MTQYLPPNLLALFAARDPIPYLPPVDKLPHEKKSRGYLGVGKFLVDFEDPKDTPPHTRVETRQERLERRRREKAEQVAYKLEREIALWDPTELKEATDDPFKTLFVARINYDTSESKLRREFEIYGPIKKIIMITDAETGKPRGYAFIEYEHERDMHSAYKHADGKKIDGKRVLVDVERARTVKGWLPRRLGGGLGGTRRGGADVNIKHSGREDNERERERYRLEREREDRDGVGGRAMERGGGGGGGGGVGVSLGSNRDTAVGGGPRFDIRRRSRSRDRRERERSRHRSRSRERRKRRASRDRDYEDFDKRDRRGLDKDRSTVVDREREKKKKRSKSPRDRESRSDKKRDRRDKDRSDRTERSDRGRSEQKEKKPDFREDIIKVKEEPVDDYPSYPSYNSHQQSIKTEDDEEEVKYRPNHDQYAPSQQRNSGQNGQNFSASDDKDSQEQQQQQWWR